MDQVCAPNWDTPLNSQFGGPQNKPPAAQRALNSFKNVILPQERWESFPRSIGDDIRVSALYPKLMGGCFDIIIVNTLPTNLKTSPTFYPVLGSFEPAIWTEKGPFHENQPLQHHLCRTVV